MKKPWYERFAERERKAGRNRIILDRDSKEPYLERFYVIRKIFTLGLFSVFVHRFWKSDDDFDDQGRAALHNHPWLFWGTYILKNGYHEHTETKVNNRKPGDYALKSAWALHRVVLHKTKSGKEIECWTVFLAGPRVQDWGFKDPATGKIINWKVWLENKLK